MLIPIIVFSFVMFTGLYFIWRGESNERKRSKVIKMETDLDEFEKEISK